MYQNKALFHTTQHMYTIYYNTIHTITDVQVRNQYLPIQSSMLYILLHMYKSMTPSISQSHIYNTSRA